MLSEAHHIIQAHSAAILETEYLVRNESFLRLAIG